MFQRRVNGPHVKAHGKHIASTTGGFPHIDGEGPEKRRGGRVEQGSLVPKLLQSFSSLHCHPEPLLTPPVWPLSSPSLPSSTTSKIFAFLLSIPTTKSPYLPALNNPSGPSMLFHHPRLLPSLFTPLTSFPCCKSFFF